MSLLHDLIINKLFGGGGGGSVTVDDSFSTTSENPVQNKVITSALNTATQALENKVTKPTSVVVADSAATITPVDNAVYKCTAAALTSLTITDPPAAGAYAIKFNSGSTATTTTFPASIIFPEAFAAEANTRYEINVEDGYAVAVGWPVS